MTDTTCLDSAIRYEWSDMLYQVRNEMPSMYEDKKANDKTTHACMDVKSSTILVAMINASNSCMHDEFIIEEPSSHREVQEEDYFSRVACMTLSSISAVNSSRASTAFGSSNMFNTCNENMSDFGEFSSRSMRGFIPHVSKKDSLRLENFEELLEQHGRYLRRNQ